ncbi:MAG: selenium-binding protein SBP56-related protein, partial [Pseudomonadota bacterium]
MNLLPDPTFHATAKLAMKAPVEKVAFTLMLSPDGSQPDGLAVVDVNPRSKTYGKIINSIFMPNKGDEF